jgi:hypothetical protein
MRNIIRFLRSESFIFTAILCVLVSQILHTAYLFKAVSRMNLSFDVGGWQFTGFNWLHAFLCASAIEAAILMFILNGKKRAAKIYALASFAGNLALLSALEQFGRITGGLDAHQCHAVGVGVVLLGPVRGEARN